MSCRSYWKNHQRMDIKGILCINIFAGFRCQKLQFLVEELQPVFTEDALGTSHPVRVPVGAPSEINEIFDSISYEKVTFSFKSQIKT